MFLLYYEHLLLSRIIFRNPDTRVLCCFASPAPPSSPYRTAPLRVLDLWRVSVDAAYR